MVVVDVDVAAGPDEFAGFQPGLLGQHAGQQRVGGDVERHAQEHVRGPLVQLAGQLAVGDVELEERVAGRQRHVLELGHVPGRDDVPAGIRVGLQVFDELGDLVDVAAVGGGPAAPLDAVDRAEFAVGVGPFVPDGHALVLHPLHVGVAAQEPQQLDGDGLEVHALGGDEREALAQVKAHLAAENAAGSGAGAVGFVRAVGHDIAQKVFIGRWGAHASSLVGARRRARRQAAAPLQTNTDQRKKLLVGQPCFGCSLDEMFDGGTHFRRDSRRSRAPRRPANRVPVARRRRFRSGAGSRSARTVPVPCTPGRRFRRQARGLPRGCGLPAAASRP